MAYTEVLTCYKLFTRMSNGVCYSHGIIIHTV